jgi:hypothetical protein
MKENRRSIMETPQPPQVSVSGRIVIEGHLPASSGPSSETAPAPPSPPWWKFWRGAPEKVMAKATVALAVGTAMLALGTIALAIFSLIQIFVSRDTEERQLRAYVYVKPPPFGIMGVVAGSMPYATIAFRNSGQTPAYNLRMGGNIGFGQYPLLPNQKFIDGPYGGELFLNPEAETTTGGRVAQRNDVTPEEKQKNMVTQPELDSILNGETHRLYLFGDVTYKDAFGHKRHSEYCFAYFGAGPTLTAMDYCDRHNEQD